MYSSLMTESHKIRQTFYCKEVHLVKSIIYKNSIKTLLFEDIIHKKKIFYL